MDQTETLIVPLNKVKQLRALISSIILILMGGFLLTYDAEPLREFIDPMIVLGIGFVGVAFGGFFGLLTLRKLVSKSAGSILSREGFDDRFTALSAGFIPWTEVLTINSTQYARQTFISINLKDPDRYLAKANRLQQIAICKNMDLVGAPVNIYVNALRINSEDLLESFNNFFQFHSSPS